MLANSSFNLTNFPAKSFIMRENLKVNSIVGLRMMKAISICDVSIAKFSLCIMKAEGSEYAT